MQAAVDRVMRAFTQNRPMSDQQTDAVRREVTEFAAELLEKYKNQLAHRTLSGATER
jgi:histone H3/H4